MTPYLKHNMLNRRMAVFAVPTQMSGTVYMRVDNSCMDDKRFVVIVDAVKFLKLCREGNDAIYFGHIPEGRERWVRDEKYGQAVRGFEHGEGNPVPLAEVVCYQNTRHQRTPRRGFPRLLEFLSILPELQHSTIEFNYVAFTNGITRTLWLLANTAEAFPILCTEKHCADRLFACAAVHNTSVKTVTQIFNGFFSETLSQPRFPTG